MQRYSRRKLAQAFVRLLGTHSPAVAIKALAQTLIADGRLKEMDIIVQAIAVEMLRERHHLMAQVTTARAVSSACKTQLIGQLKKITGATTVSIDYTLEPTTVGGISVTLPEGTMDSLVTTTLNRLT